MTDIRPSSNWCRAMSLAVVLTIVAVLPAQALQQPLRVREVLRLPAAGSDEPIFHLPVAAVRDNGGRFYVLDYLDHTVREFSPDGRLIREFGGEGGGPGKFRRPSDIFLRDDRIDVSDRGHRRVTTFGKGGNYIRDRPYPPHDSTGGRLVGKVIPLRHGLMLAEWYGAPNTMAAADSDLLVVYDSAGRMRGQPTPYRNAVAYAVSSSNPRLKWELIHYGKGMLFAASGDSLVTYVDAYTGSITYHRVTADGLTRIRSRQLNLPSRRPERNADVEQVAKRDMPQRLGGGTVRITYPPRVAVVEKALHADSGELWLLMRSETPQDVQTWIIVPERPTAATRTVSLPSRFLLYSVSRSHLTGFHRHESGEATFAAYQR